jgi:hypothetical protein
MKRSSLVKLNKMIWALAGVVAVLSLVIVSLFVAQSAAKPTSKAPSPPTIDLALTSCGLTSRMASGAASRSLR